MTASRRDWKTLRLGDVIEPAYGKALPQRDRISGGKVPVFGSAGIVGYHNVALTSGPTLIIGRKGNIGAAWLSERPCWPIDTTFYLRVPEGIDPNFLHLQLQRSNLRNLDTSTAVPSLRRGDLKSAELRLAPFEEQRQIVDAIEQRFSHLAAGEDSLTRAGRNLRRFRAAVINRAFARDWPLVELGDIIKSLKNGVFVSRPSIKPPGVRIFRISAVRPMRLDLSDIRYAAVQPAEVDGYLVEPGDLLFTRYSGNPAFVGTCAVVPESVAPTLHPDKLIRVALDGKRAIPDFVAMALNHGDGRREIESRLKTTAGQVGIAGGQLRSVTFALPSLEAQRNTLSDVSQKLSICDSQMEMIDRQQKRSRRLRRALLEAAFSEDVAAQSFDGAM